MHPFEVVSVFLTEPHGWGTFFDLHIVSISPAGTGRVGQTLTAEAVRWLLNFKLALKFLVIDAFRYGLRLEAKLPFAVAVHEDLSCIALDTER
jgi:hypothetical protein